MSSWGAVAAAEADDDSDSCCDKDLGPPSLTERAQTCDCADPASALDQVAVPDADPPALPVGGISAIADWWKFVKHGAHEVRASRGNQLRLLRILSLCSGLGTESIALGALGVPHEVDATCDPKDSAFRVLECRAAGQKAKHHFNDIHELLEGSAHCRFHGQVCEAPRESDVMIAGFPCQPYSSMSPKRFADGSVKNHPKTDVTSAMHDSLEAFEPSAFIFENVRGFSKRAQGEDSSPLDQFMEVLKAKGKYHVCALHIYLNEWVQADRNRPPRATCHCRRHATSHITLRAACFLA